MFRTEFQLQSYTEILQILPINSNRCPIKGSEVKQCLLLNNFLGPLSPQVILIWQTILSTFNSQYMWKLLCNLEVDGFSLQWTLEPHTDPKGHTHFLLPEVSLGEDHFGERLSLWLFLNGYMPHICKYKPRLSSLPTNAKEYKQGTENK